MLDHEIHNIFEFMALFNKWLSSSKEIPSTQSKAKKRLYFYCFLINTVQLLLLSLYNEDENTLLNCD